MTIQFQSPDSYSTASLTRSAAAADVNNDGNTDLVATSGTTNVYLLPGNGDGTFGAAQSISTTSGLQNLLLADVNSDGKTDLLGTSGSVASVLLGNGDGTFGTVHSFTTSNTASSLAAVDLNHDGKRDLVIGDRSGSHNVSVLLGNGDGTFGTAATYTASAYADPAVVADVNNDGDPDIVVGNGGTVSVLLGNGDGTFGASQAFATGLTGSISNAPPLAVADVNRDGKPDIVTSKGFFGTGVAVLLGNGDGTFAAGQNVAPSANMWTVVVTDADHDGKPDIVGRSDNSALILPGNGDGTFQATQTVTFPAQPQLIAFSPLLLAANLNGDARPDLVLVHSNGVSVAVNDSMPPNTAPTGVPAVTGTPMQGGTLMAGLGTLADADGLNPGGLSYQWQRDDGQGDWTAIAGAVLPTYTLTQDDVGHTIRAVASYVDGGGTSESVASAATATVANVNDDPTGAPAVSGTPMQGGTLTAALGTLADADGLGSISYQWQRGDGLGGWTDITDATAATYTLTQADVGHTIRAVASYMDGGGTSESVASLATAAVANVNDDPTGAPSIAGTALQGGVLTAGMGTLADADGLGSISYQWQRYSSSGWSNIVFGDTHGLGQADVGHPLRVVASYTDLGGHDEQVASAATMPVAAAALPVTLPPGINLVLNGSFEVAQQFSGWGITGNTDSNEVTDEDPQSGAQSAHLGSPTEASLGQSIATTTANRYQVGFWLRNAGGTDNAFAASFGGQDIALTATGLEAGGWKLYDAVVTATAPVSHLRFTFHNVPSHFFLDNVSVVDVTAPLGEVMVVGTAIQGATLTAGSDLADVDGMGPVDYRWERDDGQGGWTAIAGTASASYTLTQADVGHAVRAVAFYVDGSGTPESVAGTATAAVANVNDDPTGTVMITGNAQQGDTLSAGNTLDDADGLGNITYRWQRQTGATWTDIVGATDDSYTLTQDDVGHAVHVVAAYTDGEGTAEEVASTATATVANVNDDPAGAPAITGTPTQGETLTADPGTLADADGLGAIGYQWQRQTGATWTDIVGATAASHTLTQADVGHTIRAVASYTDGGGTSESVASAATATAANVNDDPTGAPTVSGVVGKDETLTAGSGTLADLDGLGTLAWQWQRQTGAAWDDIAGATAASYTASAGDVGHSLRAVATYEDGGGTLEHAASAATAQVGLINHLPTGTPAVAGSPALGNVLTAGAGTLADANGIGAIAWHWQARAGGVWSDIAGATDAAYTVRVGDVGETLRAVAAYTDGDGFQESVASNPTRTVAASGNFARTDTATGTASSPVGEAYAGPTNYLQWQYIASGDADVILGANVANVFLRGGGGNDALAVSAGSNVLDGDAGSTFMVGATGADGGADTFFVARPADGKPVWDTILHFHPGDRVTFWDYAVGRDSHAWAPGAQGAAGFEGATLHVSYAGTGGVVDAGLTFAGLSAAEASFRLAISTGTAGGHGYLAVTCTA